MPYAKQRWGYYDDAKTEEINIQEGNVYTPERMNHIEDGIKTIEREAKEQIDLTIKAFRELTVNIKDFGAVYDDPAFDNMPIISAAQDYVVANGGGDIYIPDDGVLFVKPFLHIKTGVKLIGANSRPVIRIATDVTNFYALFLIEYVEHVAIRNVEIDSNKVNRSNYDISVSPQILIQLSEASFVDVEDNTLKGNGVWIYAVFTGGQADYSRHLNFNRNHVTWEAGTSSVIGGPPGVDVDNTIIYFDAIDYKVEDNFIQTKDGVKNMTCIEAHGANATVRDNVVDGYRCGIIVWSLVAQPKDGLVITDNSIDVFGNKFINVEAGVMIGATSNNDYGAFDITGVNITDNQILLNPAKFKRGSSRGIQIALPYVKSTGWGKKIKIANNTIDSVIDATTYPDPQSVYLFTGIEMTSGRLSEVTVSGNTIKNISGIGLLLNNGFGQELDINDSSIFGNTFVDCGRNTNIAFDGFNHRTAMTIFRKAATRLNRVTIGTNFIYDTKNTGTYFTRAVSGLIATDDDQIVKSKNREDWVGRSTRPLKLQADVSDEYIGQDSSSNVTLTKDRCVIRVYAYISKSKVGQGVYLHLPLEADITADYVSGTYRLYKAGGEVQTGFLRINMSSKRAAWLMYPSLKATDITAGDRIQIDLEYPVTVAQKYTP